MKKTMVILAMCMSAMLLTQCAKKTASVASKTVSVADEVADMKSKYTTSQMAEGKVIFEGNCQRCHELHQPAEFVVKKWDKILPGMSKKADLTAEQAGKVRAWVITNAKAS